MYHIITEIIQSTVEHKRKMILNEAQAQVDFHASWGERLKESV